MDALELLRGMSGGGLFGRDEHVSHPKEADPKAAAVTRSHEPAEVEHAARPTSGGADAPGPTPGRPGDANELWHHYAE